MSDPKSEKLAETCASDFGNSITLWNIVLILIRVTEGVVF